MKDDFKTDRDQILKERHEILEKIKGELDITEVPAELLVSQAVEKGPEILTVDLYELGSGNDDVLGEFYFNPLITGDDKVGYFTAIITLTGEIDKESLGKLYEAASVLNFYLPFGAFGVSADKQFLTYKLALPYPLDTEKDSLYEQVNIAIGNAITVCDQWVDIMLRISEGQADVNSVINSLGM